MGTTRCLKLATPCLSRLTSCCSSSSCAVSTMYFYNDQYFRLDEVSFKHFLGLHRISLQEGFCAYMKFEKYFFHPTPPQFIHLNEGISLLYILGQAYLSSKLFFLPTLPLVIMQVLQGLVEMPLPPCLLYTSIALCLLLL